MGERLFANGRNKPPSSVPASNAPKGGVSCGVCGRFTAAPLRRPDASVVAAHGQSAQ